MITPTCPECRDQITVECTTPRAAATYLSGYHPSRNAIASHGILFGGWCTYTRRWRRRPPPSSAFALTAAAALLALLVGVGVFLGFMKTTEGLRVASLSGVTIRTTLMPFWPRWARTHVLVG